MPIYSNLQRKSDVPCDFARGGELIEVAPYFSATGYSDIGIKTNTVTSEHVSKFVEVSAGYSLEPIGKITYQKLTYSNTKQLLLNTAIPTTVPLNLFGNSFGANYLVLVSNIGFAQSATIFDNYRIFYSKLFQKSFLSWRTKVYTTTAFYYCYLMDVTGQVIARINYGSAENATYKALDLIETNSITAIFRADASNVYHTSSDGTSFTSRTLPASMILVGLAASSSIFLILNNSGVAYSSTDGVSWVNRGTLGYASGIKNLAFGNNTFAALTSTSQVKISTDNGVNWVIKTLPETLTWNAIVFNPFANVFVLIPNNKNYFYITTNFTVFIQKLLPFTNTSDRVGFLQNSNTMFLDQYLSQDMNIWIKATPLNGSPPTGVVIPAKIYYITAPYETYGEIRLYSNGDISITNFSRSPIFPTNTTNVNAFVRTALD